MISRRTFAATIVPAIGIPRQIAFAQLPRKAYQVGVLATVPTAAQTPFLDALRTGLRDLGYVEGRNFVLVVGSSGDFDRLPELARALVSLNVDVIVTAGEPGILAAKRATATIPIIFAATGDPVGAGHAASLARPGGNLTGFSFISVELSSKYLELLKEAVPKLSHVGVLVDRVGRTNADMARQVSDAAKMLGVRVQFFDEGARPDLEQAFAAMVRDRADGVVILPSVAHFINRERIVALSIKYRLPAIYGLTEFASVGGLLSYGVNVVDLWRRAAVFVDRILKGANPGDLPIEQATKFELVVNLKTAKTLSLTIPPSLLLRADQIIE
jgi:putative tryptophan/tyrosine transport system substrate-binding protein